MEVGNGQHTTAHPVSARSFCSKNEKSEQPPSFCFVGDWVGRDESATVLCNLSLTVWLEAKRHVTLSVEFGSVCVRGGTPAAVCVSNLNSNCRGGRR